jgi:hypothetical protein
LKYASDELKNDYDIVVKAIEEDGEALQYVSTQWKTNKNMIIKAVSQNGNALSYVQNLSNPQNNNDNHHNHHHQNSINDDSNNNNNNLFNNDYDVVYQAVSSHGESLGYASESLRRNKCIVYKAVKQNWMAISFASFPSYKHRDHFDIILLGLSQNMNIMKKINKKLKQNEIYEFEKYLNELFYNYSINMNDFYSSFLFGVSSCCQSSTLSSSSSSSSSKVDRQENDKADEKQSNTNKEIEYHYRSSLYMLYRGLDKYHLQQLKVLISQYVGLQIGDRWEEVNRAHINMRRWHDKMKETHITSQIKGSSMDLHTVL